MKNLQAEMSRRGVSISDIKNLLGRSERTVKNKLYGKTDFTFPECIKIRDVFFDGIRLEYLFSSDDSEWKEKVWNIWKNHIM